MRVKFKDDPKEFSSETSYAEADFEIFIIQPGMIRSGCGRQVLSASSDKGLQVQTKQTPAVVHGTRHK
jgi:hypothetical protein